MNRQPPISAHLLHGQPWAVLGVAQHADVCELSLETLDVILDEGSAVTQEGVLWRGALAHEAFRGAGPAGHVAFEVG
jgi:hypothetical protein